MPINMDPKKRRRATQQEAGISKSDTQAAASEQSQPQDPHCETEADREKALADAEWKNLWDATEVIDMDKW
jgi:hypothetical protein